MLARNRSQELETPAGKRSSQPRGAGVSLFFWDVVVVVVVVSHSVVQTGLDSERYILLSPKCRYYRSHPSALVPIFSHIVYLSNIFIPHNPVLSDPSPSGLLLLGKSLCFFTSFCFFPPLYDPVSLIRVACIHVGENLFVCSNCFFLNGAWTT